MPFIFVDSYFPFHTFESYTKKSMLMYSIYVLTPGLLCIYRVVGVRARRYPGSGCPIFLWKPPTQVLRNTYIEQSKTLKFLQDGPISQKSRWNSSREIRCTRLQRKQYPSFLLKSVTHPKTCSHAGWALRMYFLFCESASHDRMRRRPMLTLIGFYMSSPTACGTVLQL